MIDRRIDFSSLNPSRDVQRWEARIAAVVGQATAEYRARRSIAIQLAEWSRPLLAIATSLALIGWASLLAMSPDRRNSTADPSQTLLTYAAGENTPSSTALLQLVRGESE